MRRQVINTFSLIGILLFLSANSVNAQELHRQSIGFIGGSAAISEGVFAQSIVGQPYSLNPASFESFYVNPGFEQFSALSTDFGELTINTTIYPNPANTSFQINIDQADVNIRIIDIQGRQVHSEELVKYQTNVLDCFAWSSGTYFILFYRNEQQIQASKLVITHQ